ncbi:MAG: hypothetical protein ACI9MX_002052 [Candidatus Aldehydirespiratoraceae bacterium]|jgi:hypothetical protein
MPQRFFFLHMQKTAGTALWQRLQEAFPREALYPGVDDGPMGETTLLTKWVRAAFERRGDEIAVVAGHFPLCTTELLGGDFTTFTILRDPVDRTLSALRHYRETTLGEADTPLEEVYADPQRQWVVHNHMVKMLSLTVDEMDGDLFTAVEFTPARLERAKAALQTIDVVGTQDRFEPFCDELSRRFGWNLGEPRFANRTTPTPASDSLCEQIAADQADDIALYEYARTLAV